MRRTPLQELSADCVIQLRVGAARYQAIAAWVILTQLERLDAYGGCLAITEPTADELHLLDRLVKSVMHTTFDDLVSLAHLQRLTELCSRRSRSRYSHSVHRNGNNRVNRRHHM
jgi:hypothetical protein